MTKKDFELLGRIFASEVEGFPVFQGKSIQYNRLSDEVLCERSKVILPGTFPVTITGWTLTPKGHYEYCMDCENHMTAEELEEAKSCIK